jgi:divalent metal cation (Fe/Co/Zn/Cd) transporter
MQRLTVLTKVGSFLIGVVLAILGTGLLVMAYSAVITPESARLDNYAAAAGFFLIAFPFIVFPFSKSLAKACLALSLSVFAIAMLWVAFWPPAETNPTILFQVAAVAFAIGLVFRLSNFVRTKRRAVGT